VHARAALGEGTSFSLKIAPTESTIEVFEPTIETIERKIDVCKPTIEVLGPTIDVCEPTIEGIEPTIDVCEPTIEVLEPTIDVIETTLEAPEPAIERIEPRKSITESIRSIVDARRNDLDLEETPSKPETCFFESVTNTFGLMMSIVDLITSTLGSIVSTFHPDKSAIGSRRALPEPAAYIFVPKSSLMSEEIGQTPARQPCRPGPAHRSAVIFVETERGR
jgi:hypothetical protein